MFNSKYTMNDSIFTTIVKSIGATIGACILGIIFEFLLLMVFAWLMDFGMFWFIIIGAMLLPIITFVPVGATAFLIQLFKNRIAGFIFGIIVSIWLLVTTIEFWCYLNQFDLSGGEWFMAITITITMIYDIIASFAVSFAKEE